MKLAIGTLCPLLQEEHSENRMLGVIAHTAANDWQISLVTHIQCQFVDQSHNILAIGSGSTHAEIVTLMWLHSTISVRCCLVRWSVFVTVVPGFIHHHNQHHTFLTTLVSAVVDMATVAGVVTFTPNDVERAFETEASPA